MATNDKKRTRTVIGEEAKALLEEFFANGMKSKGVKCLDLIKEAASKTGLAVDVVKEWVGNRCRRKKPDSRTQTTNTSRQLHRKGVSAYNAFVHDKKAELGGIGANWSNAWNALSPVEKEEYKKMAVKMTSETTCSKEQLLSNIFNNIQELSKHHDITVACVGTTGDGSQILFGNTTAETFFLQRKDVLKDLLMFCNEKSNKESDGHSESETECTKLLRKKAAEHLNILYKTATGTVKAFPYKKVFDGEVIVNGLPEPIYPLRFPSHYGASKLHAILACEKIEVLSREVSAETETSPNDEESQETRGVSGEEDSVLSQEVSAETETSSNVEESQETQGVSKEDAAVLLPLFPEIQIKGKKIKARKQQPDTQEYIVEQIMSAKKIKGKQHYLVKWEGFPPEENTWEPVKNIPKNVLDFFLNN